MVNATNHPNAAAPKATPRPSATTPAQTPQQKFLAWYNATGQHDVLTLTRDTSTVTADENSGRVLEPFVQKILSHVDEVAE